MLKENPKELLQNKSDYIMEIDDAVESLENLGIKEDLCFSLDQLRQTIQNMEPGSMEIGENTGEKVEKRHAIKRSMQP